jgi:hypothetical protein
VILRDVVNYLTFWFVRFLRKVVGDGEWVIGHGLWAVEPEDRGQTTDDRGHPPTPNGFGAPGKVGDRVKGR